MEEWAWRAKLRLSRFGGMEYWKTRNAERQTFSHSLSFAAILRRSEAQSSPPNPERQTPNAERGGQPDTQDAYATITLCQTANAGCQTPNPLTPKANGGVEYGWTGSANAVTRNAERSA